MLVDLDFNYEETTAAMVKFRQEDIEELRQWSIKIDNSKCIPKNLSDKQIVLFYNVCYGDLEKTKMCIEKYYTYRNNAPELFDYRIWNPDLKQAAEVLEVFHVPGKSSEGYEIIYHRLHNTDPSYFDLVTFCKLLFMVVDLSLTKRGPQPGYIVLFDMEGIKMGHLTRINLSIVRKIFQYVQEAVPVRVQAIHVLNTEPILDKLLSLTKPFLDSQLLQTIHFYKKHEVPEKIHKIVPKSSLPSDYGGTLPDTQTLHKKCMEDLKLLEDYFKTEEEQRLAAMSDRNGANSLEGTFRKLDID
ncbi:unnamed protein product [Arctia plantaginis]|uniref:CRAL-TRIO domain-containing protein n=1 Tax=Arctia plantaginis TaxID=874455 RepID=A0A8S0YY86_ARCPL|nr:unnamed protein product [Arctia plantaginis]